MATLLLIDDSDAHLAHLREAVCAAKIFDQVIEAREGLHGLKRLLSESVDVVVCDLEMPGFDGEKLLQIKIASPGSQNIPFLFVTGSSDLDRRARLLEIGASDVIAKPYYIPDLLARLRLQLKNKRMTDELRLKTETMARLSTTDAVTGLRTRRYVSDALSIEYLRARRYGSPLCVLMADLDHFKQVNDQHGHLAGDLVLHGVSEMLLGQIRATDVAGRYGGEEILVVLAQNEVKGGIALAERWRKMIEDRVFETSDGRQVEARISIGVAAFDESMTVPEDLIARADAALYTAKEKGRNRVVVYDPKMDAR